MAKVEKPDSEALIAELRAKLASLESENADLRVTNIEASARAAYFAGENSETPTGRTVKVKRCKNPWVKKEEEQEWETVDEPTFLYTVSMPPVGGTDMKLNGEEKYHGQTYEMTMDTLRQVKEIVFRLKAHDAAIHGSDEDNFRPRVSKQISLKTGQIRNLPPNWMPGAR